MDSMIKFSQKIESKENTENRFVENSPMGKLKTVEKEKLQKVQVIKGTFFLDFDVMIVTLTQERDAKIKNIFPD